MIDLKLRAWYYYIFADDENKNLAEEKSHSPILTRICEIIRLRKAYDHDIYGKKNAKEMPQQRKQQKQQNI